VGAHYSRVGIDGGRRLEIRHTIVVSAQFTPPLLFRNAHLQSILPTLKWRRLLLARRASAMLDAAQEHILDCGDGVRLMGLHSPHRDATSRPLAMLLHGWEGDADSLYVLSLASHLYSLGYDIFRLNFRDHGPTHHLNRDIFHSCRIAEVIGAVRAVQEKFSPTSLNLAGFSLGGNFALRIAARAPQAGIRLAHAVAVCPVLSPRKTLDALQAGWFVYEQYFVRKWKSSLRIKQQLFPRHFDFDEIFRLDNLNDMTDVLVRKYSEFPDMHTYLEGYAIVGEALTGLTVDSHILLAADDPIIPIHDAALLARSPKLAVNILPRGGHCGFLESVTRASWADNTIGRILETQN
jgi:predicted alpha/beta-fold hydrolase